MFNVRSDVFLVDLFVYLFVCLQFRDFKYFFQFQQGKVQKGIEIGMKSNKNSSLIFVICFYGNYEIKL